MSYFRTAWLKAALAASMLTVSYLLAVACTMTVAAAGQVVFLSVWLGGAAVITLICGFITTAVAIEEYFDALKASQAEQERKNMLEDIKY